MINAGEGTAGYAVSRTPIQPSKLFPSDDHETQPTPHWGAQSQNASPALTGMAFAGELDSYRRELMPMKYLRKRSHRYVVLAPTTNITITLFSRLGSNAAYR